MISFKSKIAIAIIAILQCSNINAAVNHNNNASVSFLFLSDGKVFVECGENSKTFDSMGDFSNNNNIDDINNITGNYCTLNPITYVSHSGSVIFENFKITDRANFMLKLKGTSGIFTPNVVIDYALNKVQLPILEVENINSLDICSRRDNMLTSGTINYTNLNEILFNGRKINTNNIKINNINNSLCKTF